MSKTAFITGGTRGIGLGVSTELAKKGFDLAINGLRNETGVMPVLDELKKYGNRVIYQRGDISSCEDRKRMVTSVLEQFGKINVLVNNAGISPPVRKDILEATEENFSAVMKVNLQGPYFLTQLVANKMIENKRQWKNDFFCIINISSVSATVASIDRGEYCMSKAGLAMATKLWAARLGGSGISVYEIRPGIIRTDMTTGVQEKYDLLFRQGIAIQQRWGTPEDVGRVAASMAMGNMPYSTGQVVLVDGGMTIARL